MEEEKQCQCCMRDVLVSKMATETCCKQCDDEDNIQRHLSVEYAGEE